MSDNKTVVVPVEPTEEMKQAGYRATCPDGMEPYKAIWIWKAMIAAAPASTAQPDEREALHIVPWHERNPLAKTDLAMATIHMQAEINELRAALTAPQRPLYRWLKTVRELGYANIDEALAALASQDAQERDNVIEECATVADKEYAAARERFNLGQEWSASTIAGTIRALKSTAQPVEKPEGKAEHYCGTCENFVNKRCGDSACGGPR
jgi:hypothetical protein